MICLPLVPGEYPPYDVDADVNEGGGPGGSAAAAAAAATAPWRRLLDEVILPKRWGASWQEYYPHVVHFLRALPRGGGPGGAGGGGAGVGPKGGGGGGSGSPPPPPLVVVEVGTAYGGLGDRLLGDIR